MTIDAVRPIEGKVALRAYSPIIHQLRPHFASADGLIACWRRQVRGGYRLIAVWRDGVPIALAGCRQQENLIYEPFLYVGDLVTDANLRSSSLDNVLMSHPKAEAERLGCARLMPDAPLSNMLSHRFYYRNGLLTGALRSGMSMKTRAAR